MSTVSHASLGSPIPSSNKPSESLPEGRAGEGGTGSASDTRGKSNVSNDSAHRMSHPIHQAWIPPSAQKTHKRSNLKNVRAKVRNPASLTSVFKNRKHRMKPKCTSKAGKVEHELACISSSLGDISKGGGLSGECVQPFGDNIIERQKMLHEGWVSSPSLDPSLDNRLRSLVLRWLKDSASMASVDRECI